MKRLPIVLCLALLTPLAATAATTDAQGCAAFVEKASGKFMLCKLAAAAKFEKAGDATVYAAALEKCTTKFEAAFAKAQAKFGMDCPMTEPPPAFDDYLQQCSDDVAGAATGAALHDYPAELDVCTGDLDDCEVDYAACLADPPVILSAAGPVIVFGDVPVGSTRTRSVRVQVDAGYFLAAAGGGGINPPFNFDFGSCADGGQYGPTTCTIVEYFSPASPGAASGVLEIYSCPLASGDCVTISGIARGNGI